jgi:hypothetical protein
MLVSFAGNTFVTTALPQFLNVNLTRLLGIQLTVSFSPFGPSHFSDFSCVLLMRGLSTLAGWRSIGCGASETTSPAPLCYSPLRKVPLANAKGKFQADVTVRENVGRKVLLGDGMRTAPKLPVAPSERLGEGV